MNRFRLLLIRAPLLIWLVAAPAPATAQTLGVSPGDKKMVISGTLGAGANVFVGHLTLTLSGDRAAEAKPVQVRRSDLVRRPDTDAQEQPREIIDRGNLVVGSVALKLGQSVDVPVTVNNVTRHGTYDATIKFWLPEQEEAAAEVVELTLQVAPKVDVRPPSGASAQVAHCGLAPCSWSNWLPQGLIGSRRGLLLDNQTAAPVTVLSQDIVLRGERGGRILTTADLRPSIESDTLPASHSVPVRLDVIDRDALPPDRYVGTLSLGLKGASAPVAVGFTLDVRTAPWWPLLVLLLGVVIGRLVKGMSTPEALLQFKLLERLSRIEESVRSLGSESDRRILLGRLEDLKARIEAASEPEQVLTQQLDKVEVAARLLHRLEALAREVERLPNETLRRELQTKIEDAAAALIGGDADRCAQLINEIEVSLRRAQTEAADSRERAALVTNALDSAREAADAGGEASRVFAAATAKAPGRPMRFVAALAGSNLLSAGVRFRVVRPILFLLLLALLTALGLKSLYIDSGANFGVGGLYDYLGLFLWGLSAEVVQHTLQNLPLPKS